MAYWTAQLAECVEENVDKRNQVGAVAVLPSIHLHQCQGAPPPCPLSSRPEFSWAVGPPKEMKNGSHAATALHGRATLHLVIPSEAEGPAVQRTFRGNVFRQSVAQRRDLRFHFRQKRMCCGRIASRFRFSIKANRRSLGYARDDKVEGGGPPWHEWRWMDGAVGSC